MPAVLLETLRDGSLRLRDAGASFTVRRVRPGVVSVMATGADTGQFDTMVVTELSRELERFPIEHEVFVDALQVSSVELGSRRTWTDWLQSHRDRLRRIHMLARTRQMQLIAAIAGHDSGAKVRVYDEAGPFEAALHEAAGDWPSRQDKQPPHVADIRMTRTKGTTSLDDGRCQATFTQHGPNLLVLRLCGHDHGILATAIFDILGESLRNDRRLSLFIDLRDVTMPAPAVSELWARWFAVHRQRLASVVLLATSRAVAVTADVARWRSRTGELIRVLRDPEVFDKTLAQATSSRAPSPL